MKEGEGRERKDGGMERGWKEGGLCVEIEMDWIWCG